MTHRSTNLKTAARNCPHAVTLAERGAPRDTSIFAYGTAAHVYLDARCRGADTDALFRDLAAKGKPAPDAGPPLPLDALVEGWDLGRAWERAHGFPPDARSEVPMYIDKDGNACDADNAYLGTSGIDLVAPHWDEEEDSEGVLVRDYKGSWHAEDELDTLQRRLQAVLAWAHYPDAEHIRLEIGALRTRRIHARTLFRGVDDELVEQWRRDLINAAEALDADRTPAPGVRCLGCPYSAVCDHAWSAMQSEAGDVVQRWAVAQAIADGLRPLARAATENAPHVDGVGYYEVHRSKAAPGAVKGAVRRFVEHTGHAMPTEAVEALVRSLRPTKGNLEALGKVIYRGDPSGRAAWLAGLLVEKVEKKWGRLP